MKPNDLAGSIGMFGGNFAPKGTALCDRSLLSIQDHGTLYATIFTWYGGDGRDTFGLPDLRGRAAMGSGQGTGLPGISAGQFIGNESETIELKVPQHNHSAEFNAANLNSTVTTSVDPASVSIQGSLKCNASAGGLHSPKDNYPGVEATTNENLFTPTSTGATMAPNPVVNPNILDVNLSIGFGTDSVSCLVQNSPGGTAPVTATTLPPIQTVNYCINIVGDLPRRT